MFLVFHSLLFFIGIVDCFSSCTLIPWVCEPCCLIILMVLYRAKGHRIYSHSVYKFVYIKFWELKHHTFSMENQWSLSSEVVRKFFFGEEIFRKHAILFLLFDWKFSLLFLTVIICRTLWNHYENMPYIRGGCLTRLLSLFALVELLCTQRKKSCDMLRWNLIIFSCCILSFVYFV